MVSTIKYKKNTGLPRFGGFKCKEGKDWEKNMYKEKKNTLNYVIRNEDKDKKKGKKKKT